MYSKKVFKHFTNPKFAGELKSANGIGEEGNVKCGDIMKIFIKVKNNIIQDIKFKTYGCIAAIASSDVLCELAKGKKIDEALKIDSKDIIKKLDGMPVIKHHCSVLGTEALENAIKDYKKNGK
jgi:nitrogen fixation NifU-like protein|tara:strand:+ start:2982 stop:3350 length:369 start_codon:yes stop_codon:yes gene_type:complete